jgi:SAM-dependent methyltransferase
MTRLVRLDSGDELTPANYRNLGEASAGVRLKLLEPAPPFRALDILRVGSAGGGDGRRRDWLLHRHGDAFGIVARDELGRRGAGEILGRVVAVERGTATFSLETGLLGRCPRCWLPRAIDALDVLARFRHPLTPPLFLGNQRTCLAGVHDKYDSEVEVRQYAARVTTGLEPHEREIVERYLRPGGRLLDVGCGAGREAIGLARAGFRVVGIDIAPRMIEAARLNAEHEALAISFRVQSATELDEPPGSFDGVFFAGSYHHIPGRALRVETLRRIARALTADGVLILMVHYGGARGRLSRSRLVDLMRRAGRKLTTRLPLSEPGDRHMRHVSEGSDATQPCFFHDFESPAAVRAELEAAGLSPEEVEPSWWVVRLTERRRVLVCWTPIHVRPSPQNGESEEPPMDASHAPERAQQGERTRRPYEPPAIAWEEDFEPYVFSTCGKMPGMGPGCAAKNLS